VKKIIIALLVSWSFSFAAIAPIKVLLITGGCCHDYNTQKNTLKTGLEARAVCSVTQLTFDNSGQNPFVNTNWADSYDVVVHDECWADLTDPTNTIAPHKNGKPAVFLHCAMHTYGLGKIIEWGKFCGIGSTGHGPNQPISIKYTDKTHPITQGAADWTTPTGDELYNNAVAVYPSAHELARGYQSGDAVVAWTNTYGSGKSFATTIGHANGTVADSRYLDMVARGMLWTCNKLNADYLKTGTPPVTAINPAARKQGIRNARIVKTEYYNCNGQRLSVFKNTFYAPVNSLVIERITDAAGIVHTAKKVRR
jgi:hypothetical protein